jgi:hypothetical protein
MLIAAVDSCDTVTCTVADTSLADITPLLEPVMHVFSSLLNGLFL